MPFQDRFIVDGGEYAPPGKFYFSTTGREVFGESPLSQINNAMQYVRLVMRQPGNRRESFHKGWDFMIGVLWGDINKGQRVADVFGYKGINDWPPKNLVVRPREIREGFLEGENIAYKKEEMQSLLEGEGLLRQNVHNLVEYFSSDRLPRTGLFEGHTYFVRL